MKYTLVISIALHLISGWILYATLLPKPNIPIDAVMTVDLVSIAPAPAGQKPEVKPKPVAPPPQPKPQPQPEAKPIVKNPASKLKKLLAEKLKKQRQERERESSSRPTPTARNLAQLVPTVAPLDVNEVPTVRVPAVRQSRQGPVAVEGPAGLERYDYYLSAIRSNLHRNWSVPRVSNSDRLMTVVQINILRTGRIENFQITRRSGNAFFDQSVRDAVTASRFPPFADDYPDNRMSVTVRFRPEGD